MFLFILILSINKILFINYILKEIKNLIKFTKSKKVIELHYINWTYIWEITKNKNLCKKIARDKGWRECQLHVSGLSLFLKAKKMGSQCHVASI